MEKQRMGWKVWGGLLLAWVMSLMMGLRVADAAESGWGKALCPPEGVLGEIIGCLPLGSRAYLEAQQQAGVTFPLTPVNGVRLSDAWFTTPEPVYYAWVKADKARMYYWRGDGLDDSRPARTYPPGLVFVSYDAVQYLGKQRVYRVDAEAGLWMWGRDLWPVTPSSFRGLYFRVPPSGPFAWVLQEVQPHRAPGWHTPLVPHLRYQRYDVVWVYRQQEVEGSVWYEIAPGAWVEQRVLAVVTPRSAPPEGVTSARWIEINLFEQTLAAYEGNRLVYATLVSTGVAPFWTRPGLFSIYKKVDTTPMRGAFEEDKSDYYMLEDVPWTMYFDEARALHGAYWHDGFGYPRSHGCVNLSITDAHWLFQWAQEGDQVYVWDPSGKTPTDPSLYGSGGA